MFYIFQKECVNNLMLYSINRGLNTTARRFSYMALPVSPPYSGQKRFIMTKALMDTVSKLWEEVNRALMQNISPI